MSIRQQSSNTPVQQEFVWPDDVVSSKPRTVDSEADPPVPEKRMAPASPVSESSLPSWDDVPIAKPLSRAVEHGVFGMTAEGPIEPDEEGIRAMTEEQAREMLWLLRDIQAVEDSLRTGEDPKTGKTPKTPEAQAKLRENLEREEPRLKQAYANALSAYADAFGDEAGKALDLWVRKTVADCTIEPTNRYDPGHPWHYYREGDSAPPIPVDQIEPDLDVGRFIERELPKNPAKRLEKLRSMLDAEKLRVEEDKRRYQKIVEKGAEALSRYDREIAHTSDEMAVATALALKYNHIRFGLGRVAWLQQTLAQ
jgi:hypothetical protein